MTIGIYALYWEEQDLIYIGQSINMDSRLKDHIYKLKRTNHSNHRVQDAFNEYGVPKLIVIEECHIEELNTKEVYWTEEFDSLNTGLNIVEAGVSGGYGENHGRSKYSNEQIIQVFNLLVHHQEKSLKEISAISEVSYSTVKLISAGNKHCWLENQYPQEYAILKNLRGKRASAKGVGILYPIIISPEGTQYCVENVNKFAKEHKLTCSNLHNLLTYKVCAYRGWKLL